MEVYYLPRIGKATGRTFGGLDSSHIVEPWPWHLPQTQEQIPPSPKHKQAWILALRILPRYPTSAAQVVGVLSWQGNSHA